MGDVIQFPGKYDPELTYYQLAARLGCSVRKVRYMAADGMPSCGVGYDGKRRFRLSEVQQWLRDQEAV